jgi:hypothetical protein
MLKKLLKGAAIDSLTPGSTLEDLGTGLYAARHYNHLKNK